jgi:hypothetical protein
MKNIYIPNPCSENWNEMNPEEKGRFCSVCSKCVIDFTEKKASEIQQIITEKSDESVCGRFYNHQLNNEDSKTSRLKERFFRYIPASFQDSRISLGLFSLMLFITGCAKEKETYVSTTADPVIKKDSIQKNDSFIMGAPLMQIDSAAKIPKKDSVTSKKKKK